MSDLKEDRRQNLKSRNLQPEAVDPCTAFKRTGNHETSQEGVKAERPCDTTHMKCQEGCVSPETLPKIRAVVRDRFVKSAIGSLFIWSILNAGAWFLLDFRGLKLSSDPEGMALLVVYGSLVSSIVMLLFFMLGLVTRSPRVMTSDWCLMIAAGFWSLGHDFVAARVLEPYGYVEPSYWIWPFLGLIQLLWGWRQFLQARHIRTGDSARVTRKDLAVCKTQLRSFVLMEASLERGIVKCFVADADGGAEVRAKAAEYTGAITDDVMVLVSRVLRGSFVIDRAAVEQAAFNPECGKVVFEGRHTPKTIVFTPVSVLVLKMWLGRMRPCDITHAASEKVLTLSLLKPWLSSENLEIRTASVAALSSLSEGEAAHLAVSYVDSAEPQIRVAALTAAAQLKSAEVVQSAFQMLGSDDVQARVAAAIYFSSIPYSQANESLERAYGRESDSTAKKELWKAMRATEAKLRKDERERRDVSMLTNRVSTGEMDGSSGRVCDTEGV